MRHGISSKSLLKDSFTVTAEEEETSFGAQVDMDEEVEEEQLKSMTNIK